MTDQQTLDGLDTTRVKFVGARYDTRTPNLQIGDELEFKVHGRVVGVGDEEKADGSVGHTVKLGVERVVPLSFEEPKDPNQPELLDEDGSDEPDGTDD